MTLYNTSKHKVFRCSKTTTKVKRDRTRQNTYKTRHTQNKHSQKNKRNGGGRVTKRMKKSLSKSYSMGFGSRRLQCSRFKLLSSTELVALSETIYNKFFRKFNCCSLSVNAYKAIEEEDNIKANIRVLMYNVLRKQTFVDLFVAYKMIEICVPFVQKRIKTYIDDHKNTFLQFELGNDSETKKIRKFISDQYNNDQHKDEREEGKEEEGKEEEGEEEEGEEEEGEEKTSEAVYNNYTVNIQTLFTEIIQSTFEVLKMSKRKQIYNIIIFVWKQLKSIVTLSGGSLLLAEHFAKHCGEIKFFSSWRIQSVLLYYSIPENLVYKGQLSATHIIGGKNYMIYGGNHIMNALILVLLLAFGIITCVVFGIIGLIRGLYGGLKDIYDFIGQYWKEMWCGLLGMLSVGGLGTFIWWLTTITTAVAVAKWVGIIIGVFSVLFFLGFLCKYRISGTKAILSGADWVSNQYAHLKDKLWHQLPKSLLDKYTTLARTQAEFLGTCVYLISCKTSYDFLSKYNSNATKTQPLQRRRERQFIAYSDNLLKSHKKMQQKKNKRESEKMFQKVIDSITQDDEDYEDEDLDAPDRHNATKIIRQIIRNGRGKESTDITANINRLLHIDGSEIKCELLRTMIYRNLNKANTDNTILVSNIFRNVKVSIYRVPLLQDGENASHLSLSSLFPSDGENADADGENAKKKKIWESLQRNENNLYVVECTASGKSINKQKYFFADEMWNYHKAKKKITLKGKKYTKIAYGTEMDTNKKNKKKKYIYIHKTDNYLHKGVYATVEGLRTQKALVVSDIVRDNYLYIFRRPENKDRVKWNNWFPTKKKTQAKAVLSQHGPGRRQPSDYPTTIRLSDNHPIIRQPSDYAIY